MRTLSAIAFALAAVLAVLLLSPSGSGVDTAPADETPASLSADWLPARPADAFTGSEFARRTTGFMGSRRQAAALRELRRGNFPDFLRDLKPVKVADATADGRPATVTFFVMPDYLAIGSEQDFLRIPLTRPSAVAIAREFGFVLPTRKMVDLIYEQADLQLEPIPLPPGPKMRSSPYYLRHQRLIEEQRAGRALGELTSGHKKDVVLTNRLHRKAGRIAIYGWHRTNGDPIQPLSTVHGARYADYSHGVRLVYATVWLDGEPRSIYDLLESPVLAPLLSYEGVIHRVRNLMRPQPQ